MKVWVCLSARQLDGCTGPKTGPMREAHKGCGPMRLVPADAPANEIEQKARHLKQILATPRHPNASDIDLLDAMGDLLVALAASQVGESE